ncbi:MAG: hypothetical protein PHD03_01235 [Bacilli bacterium]|nr:hypothetical protein [Bacilli bacterium]MDD4406553.1 hypothetical protein [Bacilli bacterium]
MFFTINDIIELNEKNYLVQKVALVDNEAYYEVQEIEKENNELLFEKLMIKGIKEEEKLYIEEINDEELLVKIKENLKS